MLTCTDIINCTLQSAIYCKESCTYEVKSGFKTPLKSLERRHLPVLAAQLLQNPMFRDLDRKQMPSVCRRRDPREVASETEPRYGNKVVIVSNLCKNLEGPMIQDMVMLQASSEGITRTE